jgi:hemoglobin-like flavoprotein
VKISFYMIVSTIEQKPEGDVHLERIAVRHSRKGLDIRPHLYDQWLECLVQAVRECDPLFSDETEQAWRRVVRVGIEFMKKVLRSPCPVLRVRVLTGGGAAIPVPGRPDAAAPGR